MGAASLYSPDRFPHAEIHCFEPIPENYAIIVRNVEGRPNSPPSFALGAREEHSRLTLGFGPQSRRIFVPTTPGQPRNGGNSERAHTGAIIEDGTAPPPELIKSTSRGPSTISSQLRAAGARARALDHGRASRPPVFRMLEFLSRWFDIENEEDAGASDCSFPCEKP